MRQQAGENRAGWDNEVLSLEDPEDGQDPLTHGMSTTAQAGNSLGDAPSVQGNSFITWTATGTRIGSIVS